MAHTTIEEKDSLQQYNNFVELWESGKLSPTKNVLEAVRRRFFVGSHRRVHNRMVLIAFPSQIKKKDEKYFKPYSTVTKRVLNWYDATEELEKLFKEIDEKVDFEKLTPKHFHDLNHQLFLA